MAKILLVDDDYDYLYLQRVQLEAAGYEVDSADTTKAAQKKIEEGNYDVGIFDLMMEEVDAGFTLCQKAKKLHPDKPVIMVTAVTRETGLEFDSKTNEERSWIKADVVLDKPIRFEQLKGEIERLLS